MVPALVIYTAFQEVTWQDGSAASFADELALFRVRLQDGAESIRQLSLLLSPDETERANRYRRPDDQLRFSCTRSVLRLLLARYIHRQPDCVEFIAGKNRKPVLKGAASWHFNISHSGDWILIAISKGRVGTDLEYVTPNFPFTDLLQSSFDPDEHRYIITCPDARFCFYQLWTRKEALVKATGKGMDDTFARVPSLTGIHPVDGDLIGADGHWTVHSFCVDEGYPAAVAYEGTGFLLPPRFYTVDARKLMASD